MKKLYVLSLIFGVLFGRSEVTFAQTSPLPNVYISEVAWSGSALSTADEWLEITNRSSEAVDLGGWIVDGAATSAGAIQIAPDTFIESHTTLLIANYNADDPKTTLTVTPQLITNAISLANSGLTLRLIDSVGIVVDTLAFGSSPNAGGTSPFRSAVRLETGEIKSAETSANILQSTQLGTPGAIDITWTEDTPIHEEPITIESPSTQALTPEVIMDPIPTVEPIEAHITEPVIEPETLIDQEPILITEPPVIPEQVIEEIVVIDLSNQKEVQISELMPNPLDGIEWVELENPSTDIVTLDGMYMTDASGSSTPLMGALEAEDFTVIESPKGKLNNDGDTLTLFTAGGDITNTVTYGTELLDLPKKGESIGLIENEWTILSTATPNDTNQSNPAIEISAEEVLINTPDVLVEADEMPGLELITTEELEILELSGVEDENTLPQTVTIVSIAEKPNTNTSTTNASTKKKANEEIMLTGIITVPPGELGKQIAYMEGYQIYMHSADWPTLETGDTVQVSGTLTISNGEPRLKLKSASDITIQNHGKVTTQLFRSSMLKAEYTGFEVSFEGIIVDRTKKNLHIETDGSQVQVDLPKEVNGLLLAQDTLVGNAIIRGGKEGFYLETLSKDALEIRATDPAPTQSQAHTNHGSSKSMAGAGLATGTLGALGYWLRTYLMLA